MVHPFFYFFSFSFSFVVELCAVDVEAEGGVSVDSDVGVDFLIVGHIDGCDDVLGVGILHLLCEGFIVWCELDAVSA